MVLNFAGLSIAFTWNCLSNEEEGMSGGMDEWAECLYMRCMS
jgi:hypothetical protein